MKLFDVKFEVHWSWVLFPAIAVVGFSGLNDFIFRVAVALIVTAASILHELGHALTARCYGFTPKKIQIFLLGGMAQIEGLDRATREENFWITFAGPLVNIVSFVVIFILHGCFVLQCNALANSIFVAAWLSSFLMGVLNLIPMYPMDGGRIFQLLLSKKIKKDKAIWVAASLSCFLSIFFVAFGFYFNFWMISVVAAFVLFGAVQALRELSDQ